MFAAGDVVTVLPTDIAVLKPYAGQAALVMNYTKGHSRGGVVKLKFQDGLEVHAYGNEVELWGCICGGKKAGYGPGHPGHAFWCWWRKP